jgi:class 3 adenylate cyclase
VMSVFLALEERQRIVNAFGQQVSPAIVEELLKQGPEIPSKRTFVCVLFMDIRDFTRLVEKKTPEEFVAYQNAVFGAAIAIVDRNHGVINQFLGDGFMATFGAPVATGRDCRNALSAARELLAAVKALSELRPYPGDQHRHRAARWRGGLRKHRLAGAAAVFDQRQRGDPRSAHRAAQQGLRFAAPRLGRGVARNRRGRSRRRGVGGGAGEGPRRADRDLSPCLNGLNYDVVEIPAVFHGARLFRLDRER